MKILFFDGYCGLCNGVVDFLMKKDKAHQLKFASLQGETAKKMLSSEQVSALTTVIYHRDNKIYERSAAALMVLSDLGGVWFLLKIFFLMPRVMRDGLYNLVAQNRYRFFKKRDTCRLPQGEEKDRLLT